MDLRKNFPRSPREKLAGVVMLPRTIDKARATRDGTPGEYKYGCRLDQDVFEFLDIDELLFAEKSDELDDAALERWIQDEHLADKTAAEIEEFNERFLADGPEPGSDSEKRFLEQRNRLDPSRTEVTSWAALLDLEEGRLPAGRGAQSR